MHKRQKSSLSVQSTDAQGTAPDDEVIIVEEQKELIEQLFEKTDSYIKTNVSLLKLKTVDKTATVVSSLTDQLALFSLCFLLILMISAGAAVWVGQVLKNMPAGFVIVAGFYALLIIVYLLMGRKVIRKNVRESVISDLIKSTSV